MRKRLYPRLILSVVLLALAVLTSFPTTSEACVYKWGCYDSCNLSWSDCTQFGGGDMCFEDWQTCWAICESFTC